MKGWARRKITYNIGKGGGSRASPKDNTAPPRSSIQPFHWWTAPIEIETNERFAIYEIGGPVYLDKEYAEMGEREGWLRTRGYCFDEHGVIVWLYTFRG